MGETEVRQHESFLTQLFQTQQILLLSQCTIPRSGLVRGKKRREIPALIPPIPLNPSGRTVQHLQHQAVSCRKRWYNPICAMALGHF